MNNKTLDKVVNQLNLAWQSVENGIIEAYDEGYTPVVWKLKQIQLAIESLETEIQEKEYEDEDHE